MKQMGDNTFSPFGAHDLLCSYNPVTAVKKPGSTKMYYFLDQAVTRNFY